MRLLLWLSGEHERLPLDEALTAFEAEGRPAALEELQGRLAVLVTAASRPEASRIVARLGLSHDASEALFATDASLAALAPDARQARLSNGIRFAVRAERVEPGGPSRMKVEKEVGAALAPGRHVDLQAPSVTVRAFTGPRRVWVGERLWDRDPKETASRHVQRRPVGSPVSLPPKTARALVNLARVGTGSLVYDPFCGTGGILLEAASLGMRTVGSDLDPHMVEASRRNLEHFRLHAERLFTADIGDAAARWAEAGLGHLDAVVSDLPYGRSASTGKEARDLLYARAFRAVRTLLPIGKRAVLGLPDAASAAHAAQVLRHVATYAVHVHRSLTRHFVVLEAT